MIIAFILVINCFGTLEVRANQRRKDNFNMSFTLTGNGAQDVINVALAQQGKTGTQLGYSEDWCANFVCDCAELAGQSNAIPRGAYYGAVPNLKEYVKNAGGVDVTSSPQPGDLVFWGDM